MCDYCKKDKILMSDTINAGVMLFNSDYSEIETVVGVFVDRGYLRLVDMDDYQCLDHGEKIKINYCPMCGDRLK